MKTDRLKVVFALGFFVLVLAVVGLPKLSTPPQSNAVPTSGDPPPTSIRIGSWNIEWLDQPARRSGPAKDVRQSAGDLADYIAASGVRVLALQEIPINAPDGSPTNTTLTETFRELERLGAGSWEHAIFESFGNQGVGIAWDTQLVSLISDRTGFLAPIDRIRSAQDKRLWARPPRAVQFSFGDRLTDFVVIPVHMKANYKGDFSVHRAEEAAALVGAIPAIRSQFTDDDILIIGDTNCQSYNDEAIQTFEDGGFLDLNDADERTYWRGSALDRILIPDGQPEFASPAFEVFFDRYAQARGIDIETFKTRWSDHQMVAFTLKVMADDD